VPPSSITISSDPVPNMNIAALVIFTSGTTGPPKGAVQRRSYITSAAEDVADHYRLTELDTVLHMLPVHHATGIGVTFLPFLVVGGCVEFRSGGFDPKWTWERFRLNANPTGSRGLSVFSGVPTIYTRLKRYFEIHISPLPSKEQEQYIAGVRRIRVFLCGTSALPRPIQEFWTRILDGKMILTRYGGTEFHTTLKTDLDGSSPANSVGRVSPGVDLRLSDEGEILVKGPNMFSKYLHDADATGKAHDNDGYFKTGDIAFRMGKSYFIQGRASLDIIKSGGYKISALDIEREILGLDYVSEVMVVGVEDEEFGQRVAAVVTLKDEHKASGLSLKKLRGDLRGVLAGYKMPTVLRVVEGEIPKGATGKVQKVLGPRYFPDGWRELNEVQVWDPQKMQHKSKL
jgi:acyl-CoA synthetase (AMP-forming)/AMP-acid ligase II